MMTSISAAVLLSSSPNPAPVYLIESDGFATSLPARRSTMLPYKVNPKASTLILRFRKDTNEALQVNVAWITDPSHGRISPFETGSPSHEEAVRNNSFVPPTSEQMPSCAPLGFVRIYGGSSPISQGRSVAMYCESNWALVKIGWDPPMTVGDRGFVKSQYSELPSREAWVEKVARHALANAAGLRSESSGNGSLAGHGVGRIKRRSSSFMLGDLSQWTSSAGWSIVEEDRYGLIHLKKGAKWAVLPLGADQIKVNGVWKEMGDSAAFYDGKLYLPEAGLKHLKDAD